MPSFPARAATTRMNIQVLSLTKDLLRCCWSFVEEFTDYDSVVVFSAVARAYIVKFFVTSH